MRCETLADENKTDADVNPSTAAVDNLRDAFTTRLDAALTARRSLDIVKQKAGDGKLVNAEVQVRQAKAAYRDARQTLKQDLAHRKHRRHDYKGWRFSVDSLGEVHICAK